MILDTPSRYEIGLEEFQADLHGTLCILSRTTNGTRRFLAGRLCYLQKKYEKLIDKMSQIATPETREWFLLQVYENSQELIQSNDLQRDAEETLGILESDLNEVSEFIER